MAPNYHHSPSLLSFHGEDYSQSSSSATSSITSFYGRNKAPNPFEEDNFSHPLPLTSFHQKTEAAAMAAPCTPGRPVFSFRSTSLKAAFPSKWEDAQKWLIATAASSPAHHAKPQNVVFVEKSRVSVDKKVSKQTIPSFRGYSDSLDHHSSSDTIADKFTKEVVSEPTDKGFMCNKKLGSEPMKDAATEVVHDVKHRDAGTEMTPLGSSLTSRCHTPFKCISPVRHNTPENRSGLLTSTNSNNTSAINITQLQECLNLGKQFDSVALNWSTKEEEEEDVSKSLRHFEMNSGFRRSISESRATAWEEEEKAKFCLRYQREEAKIQAWLNLQSAKAEAQSRKLEVKIQKMRWNLEEKLMKKMTVAERKAEEWRAAAKLEHSEQMRRPTIRSQKIIISNRISGLTLSNSAAISCACFPCNTQT